MTQKTDSRSAETNMQELPSAEELEALLAPIRLFAANPRHNRTKKLLVKLTESVPQVLLLEGGTQQERFSAALYWTLSLNCVSLDNETVTPCFQCPACLQLAARMHRDFFFLDGSEQNIKIDEIRNVRSILGEPPRQAKRRIVLFHEAQSLVDAAANALLKSFEDPRPATTFILLVPQREHLLPTLVSRSMIVTLPWPRQTPLIQADSNAPNWENILYEFVSSGKGFFQHTSAKGTITASLAHDLCNSLAQIIVETLRDSTATQASPLGVYLKELPLPRLRLVAEILGECQNSLHAGTNPTLVIEWLVTRLFLLKPRK